MPKNKPIITFEKSASSIILKWLELDHDPKCTFCGINITKRNLGGVFPNPVRICCNDLPCLIDAIDTIS
jgi:hypothetical protein